MKNYRLEILNWSLLLAIFLATYITHIKLDGIQTAIVKEQHNLPKIQLTNSSQFEQLANQLSSQWNSSGYAVYILQPKADLKTHKEKASSTIETLIDLPIRSELSDKAIFKKFKNDKYLILDNVSIPLVLHTAALFDEQCLIAIPIYKYNVIVAEMYLSYKSDSIPTIDSIQNYVLEAQVLSQLLY